MRPDKRKRCALSHAALQNELLVSCNKYKIAIAKRSVFSTIAVHSQVVRFPLNTAEQMAYLRVEE